MQWQIDPNHTTITAAVKHMMLTTVRGGFGGATGVIDFDPANPEAGGIELRIPAKNVNTHDEKRDAHLRSADFLDELGIEHDAIDDQGFAVDGDLTIRGTTKPVTVSVEHLGIAADPRAGQRVGFDAKLSFDRTQWGLTWNMPVPSGVLVGEKITIEASIAATPKVVALAA